MQKAEGTTTVKTRRTTVRTHNNEREGVIEGRAGEGGVVVVVVVVVVKHEW
jgi:hypothetical protein